METCQLCGAIIQKNGRTVCYGCRCLTKYSKNNDKTSNSRKKVAKKHLDKLAGQYEQEHQDRTSINFKIELV